MDKAMSRIEAALARIETAAGRPAAGSGGDSDAHRKLQARVRGVLGDLDGLIESLER